MRLPPLPVHLSYGFGDVTPVLTLVSSSWMSPRDPIINVTKTSPPTVRSFSKRLTSPFLESSLGRLIPHYLFPFSRRFTLYSRPGRRSISRFGCYFQPSSLFHQFPRGVKSEGSSLHHESLSRQSLFLGSPSPLPF